MFENLSLLALQEYWWFIISLLGGIFVLMMFVQGGQTLLNEITSGEKEKSLIINSLGRKWELTFTSLVLFGGALFSAFPLYYSTSFGGAYFLWMAILFAFIVQAVSYEYRKKPDNFFGSKFYEKLLYFNGTVGTFLVGVVVATLFTGGNFKIDMMNSSTWTEPTYGLEAVTDIFNIAFGLMIFFLSRVLASLYFLNNIKENLVNKRLKMALKGNSLILLPILIYVIFEILTMNGYGYDSVTGVVSVIENKYLTNFLEIPAILIMFIVGISLIVAGVLVALLKNKDRGIWISGLGTLLLVTSLFLVVGFNNTVFYPSISDLQSSITIENSSGSHYTLTVMGYASLFVPVVITYIYFVWKAMDRDEITIDEVESDPHHY